jgi:hypothetical protein
MDSRVGERIDESLEQQDTEVSRWARSKRVIDGTKMYLGEVDGRDSPNSFGMMVGCFGLS